MKPNALRPGNTLSLVSPASPVTPEQTERGIAWLLAQGYKVKIYPSTYAADGYLAGSDSERAADLMSAFLDPETEAVFCMRGGYGCSRLIPHLDFDVIAASGKLFSGFSDITVLHSALNQRGLPTLHAPMVLTLGNDKEAWVYESLAGALSGGPCIPESAPVGECVTGGDAEGLTTGGCLILICDLLGTSEQINFDGKIALIEDVDEAPHRVDAMLTHLINSGSLSNVTGIVVGEMTRTDDRPDKMIGARPWKEIVIERLSGLKVPTIINFPMGHAPQQLSLPLGVRAKLHADSGRLQYTETLCK